MRARWIRVQVWACSNCKGLIHLPEGEDPMTVCPTCRRCGTVMRETSQLYSDSSTKKKWGHS